MDRLGSGAAKVGLLFNPLSGRIRKRKDVIRRMLDDDTRCNLQGSHECAGD